ncbi:sel1 repeat family protein [Oxalobacter sp. OttesenSCG-928-P03]|nr:sel1 repeat family protein [Oxalobacter sp. OttesenSCG-928-P03]
MRRDAAQRRWFWGVTLFLLAALLLPGMDAVAQIRAKRPLSALEKERLKRLVKDAGEGYDAAQYKLGTVYMDGRLVRQSYPDAVRWFGAAASQGHVRSMYVLAMLYARGQGVAPDMSVSFNWVKKLADRGFRMAQYNLGKMFETGQGVKKDEKAARQWYELAAKEGSPSAIHALMLMDRAALSRVMADPASKAALIKGAQNGDARMQYQLGQIYLNGTGVEKDEEKARHWMMKAAEKGFADAEYVAAYLSQGKAGGGYAAPLEWTKKAADKGHVMAAFNRGGMLEAGTGVEKNWIEASRWYVYSAGAGNANAIRRLEIMDSECARFPERPHCNGYSSRDAAALGDAASLYRIGLAYKDGDGIGQSYFKSLMWFRYAAGMGHAGAQYELGDIYENALGVGRSVAQAKFWYTKSALSRNAEAAERLKRLKDDGKGDK